MNVFKNSLLLILIGGAMLLSGCGSDEEAEPPATPAPPAASQKIVFGDGFYSEEKGPTGATWRWMGDQGSLKLKNYKKDGTLQLRIEAPMRQFTEAPSILITLNGEKLDQFVGAAGKMEKTYNLTNAQLGTGDYAELRIITDKFFVPKDVSKESGDTRRLGLQVDNFSWVEK